MNSVLEEMVSLSKEISLCEKCQLHLSRIKSVPGEGNISTKILFIGEGPGYNENEQGRPFVGRAGEFLNQLLATAGVKRSEVFITNVVKCRPPANRDPLPEELSACRGYLLRQIELINPLVIVTLGRYSMGMFFPTERISAVHGQGKWINGRMIVPMFHPAAALHQPALKNSIMHDFSILPQYLKEASEKMNPSAAEEELPVVESKTDDDKEDHNKPNDAVQLSFF